MEYVSLGNTGLQVSRLCFGTWRFGKENVGAVELSLSADQRERITAAYE